jgi:hypothetical protein
MFSSELARWTIVSFSPNYHLVEVLDDPTIMSIML